MGTIEIYRIIDDLAEYYGKKDSMTDNQLELYAGALIDIPTELLKQAAAEWIKTGKWLPKASELREIVLRGSGRIPDIGAVEPDHLAAWEIDLKRRYAEGEFDPGEWQKLVEQYRFAKRYERAESLELRLVAYKEAIYVPASEPVTVGAV